MANPRWQAFLAKLRSPLMRKGEYTLDTVKRFHEALGRPGDELKIVHVAGTNAKGTVTYKIAKMLELSGHKTGSFISPHLFSWRERVQINGGLIPKEACEEFIDIYEDITKKLNVDLSFFEFFTLLAFYHYKKEKVDVAVVEVGLGGRLDATNILDKSLLSIITSISLDHTNVLGSTVDQICAEKAGIIKHGCPTLIGPQVPLEVATAIAKERESPLYVSKPGKDFREENANLLREAAKLIRPTLNITKEAEDEAISKWEAPCRLEPLSSTLLSKFPTLKSVHFDVGHNPDALEKTLARYSRQTDMNKAAIVYGCKPSKDCSTCLDVLSFFAPKLIFAVCSNEPDSKAVIPAAEIQALRPKDVKLIGNGGIEESLAEIVKDQTIEHILVIGSFTVMRESRQFFGIQDPRD